MRPTLPLLLLTILACRGEPPRSGPIADARLAALVDSLTPAVERAVGLQFREPPQSAVRTREQVRAYLTVKLDEELPPERARGIEAGYRLFGMIPDSMDLRTLLLDLLTEQVVGFYDADSAMLFAVAEAPEDQLKIMTAHEMVHALQGQHVAIDSILDARGNNDRTTAAQAILEGQAMVASIKTMTPDMDVLSDPGMWEMMREQARDAQNTMPAFAAAPLVVREGLIFPYIEGADFMRWWAAAPAHAGTMPYGRRMPVSTEQILHPERYAEGDAPLIIAFDSTDSYQTLHEDVLGELEIRALDATLSGAANAVYNIPLGWAGDRYRVVETPDGPALVWYVAWDNARSADRFRMTTGIRLATLKRPGYHATFEMLDLSGRPASKFVMAPINWPGRNNLRAIGDGRAVP